MIGNKDKQLCIRTSEFENRQAKYFADRCGISVAELWRLSLRMIQHDLQPSKIPQLKKLYEKEE